jgi:hypothetical protein
VYFGEDLGQQRIVIFYGAKATKGFLSR